MASIKELEQWLKVPEGEHLEFKEAKNRYDFDLLTKYCCALANEGGGKMVLGVTDKRPRQIVGSNAFSDLGGSKTELIRRLRIRIEASELSVDSKRVVIFEVPSRPVGKALEFGGSYWHRIGEALAPMDNETLRGIFAEGARDFSVEICAGATISDLDPTAIETFRKRWSQKSGRADLLGLGVQQLLEDAELLVDGGVTNSALLLLGTPKALSRFLPQSEIIFEYRENESSIPYQARSPFRAGFLMIHDQIWETFALRNSVYSVGDGLFRKEIPAFNKEATREGILNAFCHRDYRLEGSIFIKQYPYRAEISSPGGFPPEINKENILFRQSPRNRRLAEACEKCQLVERSGQGVDRMFTASVTEGKLPPDFSGTDSNHVFLTLHGQVQDPLFLQFMEKVTAESETPMRTDDLVVLDAIHRELPIPGGVEGRVRPLIDLGVIEKIGRKKLILSRRFYAFAGKKGKYTRLRGLAREAKKALIIQHLEQNAGTKGCSFKEFLDAFNDLSPVQVKVLLRQVKDSGGAHAEGQTSAARWFPGPNSKK